MVYPPCPGHLDSHPEDCLAYSTLHLEALWDITGVVPSIVKAGKRAAKN